LAFSNICTREWIAGCHYLKNLFLALKMQEAPPEIVLLNSGNVSDDSQMLLPFVTDVLLYPPQRAFGERVRFSLQTRIGANLGAESPMSALLRGAHVDAVFTTKSHGKLPSTSSLVWIPDFQHLHLPHMFTPKEQEDRNTQYIKWAQEADTVILSSHNALEDFQAFDPVHAHKGRVLQFVAQIDAAVYAIDPSFVCREYHLPEKFFYVPNQFWQHKNHEVVINALALLRETHPHITVVCTGNPHDYRQPRYFSDLLVKIARVGVQKQFLMLGMIPHPHIFSLMRQSLAILQPSLFEGWNTSIEETKSIGKMMIVSDIPVHREQNPPKSRYFDPKNPQALADVLIDISESRQAGPDTALEAQARAQFNQRAKAFGAQFMAIVQEALTATHQSAAIISP